MVATVDITCTAAIITPRRLLVCLTICRRLLPTCLGITTLGSCAMRDVLHVQKHLHRTDTSETLEIVVLS